MCLSLKYEMPCMSENSFLKSRRGERMRVGKCISCLLIQILRGMFFLTFSHSCERRDDAGTVHLLADWQSNDAHSNMSSLIELTLFFAFSSVFPSLRCLVFHFIIPFSSCTGNSRGNDAETMSERVGKSSSRVLLRI